jgi:hypothetical protein
MEEEEERDEERDKERKGLAEGRKDDSYIKFVDFVVGGGIGSHGGRSHLPVVSVAAFVIFAVGFAFGRCQ